jgi:hypothetical protein
MVVTGSVSNDSVGVVLRQLSAGITLVKRGGCAWYSRDAAHYTDIECRGDLAARQPIEFEVVFDRPVDRSSFVVEPALGVTVAAVLYGPFLVARSP